MAVGATSAAVTLVGYLVGENTAASQSVSSTTSVSSQPRQSEQVAVVAVAVAAIWSASQTVESSSALQTATAGSTVSTESASTIAQVTAASLSLTATTDRSKSSAPKKEPVESKEEKKVGTAQITSDTIAADTAELNKRAEDTIQAILQ